MKVVERIATKLLDGHDKAVSELTDQAIADGIAAKLILDEGLITGMSVVGERFRRHEIFLPEVLLAARAMHAGLARLRPLLLKEDVPTKGTAVLGTVQGDLHDIGKDLVGIMLRGAGFEIVDLGHDVAPERFVDTALENDASVIGMSALLTTTMPVMAQVVDLVRERGLAGRLLTCVGGAPVSAEFARDIGADAYGYDAVSAVERFEELVKQAQS
jgi:5-methyltetrahydrofolate--homocysteine methyltransferase